MPTQGSTQADLTAKRLRVLQSEMTQSEFAKKVGITRTALANYENVRNKPKPSLLKQISRKVGISDDFFVDGSARSEHELNLIVGKPDIVRSFETCQELAFVCVLREVSSVTVVEVARALLKDILKKVEANEISASIALVRDVERLAKITDGGGVFSKGGIPSHDKYLHEPVKDGSLDAALVRILEASVNRPQ